MKNLRLFLSLASLTTACHLGPRYEPPEIEVSQSWKTSSNTSSLLPSYENWWDLFEDESLNELQNLGISQNPDLAYAWDKISEARAIAGVSKADLFPQAILEPSYSISDQLIKYYGLPTNLLPGVRKILRVHMLNYELPLNMSYEFDLWQKYRGTYRSALFNIEVQKAAFQGTLLTLTSEIAGTYFNLRALDAQIDRLEILLEIARLSLKLQTSRCTAGIASYLDVTRTEQQLHNLEAEYHENLRQRGLFENALAILVGTSASEFVFEKCPLENMPPLVPIGIPSSVLLQRPDVAQAECQMASEHALIGVAYSSFFPSFKLTAVPGFLSPVLKRFLRWNGHLWQFAVDIAEVIFDGGRNLSKLDLTWARFRKTEENYRKVVLTAFQEVEDALNNVERQSQRAVDFSQAREAAFQAYLLSEQRYQAGIINCLEVLQMQLDFVNSERNLLNTWGLSHQASIELIKAIGGTWEQSDRLPSSFEMSAEEECSNRKSETGDQNKGPDVLENHLKR